MRLINGKSFLKTEKIQFFSFFNRKKRHRLKVHAITVFIKPFRLMGCSHWWAAFSNILSSALQILLFKNYIEHKQFKTIMRSGASTNSPISVLLPLNGIKPIKQRFIFIQLGCKSLVFLTHKLKKLRLNTSIAIEHNSIFKAAKKLYIGQTNSYHFLYSHSAFFLYIFLICII